MPAAAAIVVSLVGLDVARQLDLGIADTGLAFFASSTCVAAAAAFAIGRWPESRRIALLILGWLLLGVTSDFGVDWPSSRTVATITLLALGLQLAVYAHMVLAYPVGRVRDRLDRAFLAASYLIVLAWQSFPLLFGDPRGCAMCAPRVPSLFFTGRTFDLHSVGRAFSMLFIALGLAFVALLVRRLRLSPGGASRTMLPFVAAGLFAAAEFVVLRIAFLADWSGLYGPLGWLDSANTLVVPLAILIGLATVRRERGAIGDLVVELGFARPGEVRAALAKAVGDPSLELGLWLPERRRFVDEDGVELHLPRDGRGRAVTMIGPENEPLAALVHDERLLGQRPLLEAAGSAARLSLENTRLQAELRAQLAELRASRLRIVAAADSERRRLERDLHDGTQQRLLALGLALQILRDHQGDPELLDQAESELQEALRELRDLARGIHPAILSEQGLGAAVRSLADRAPVVVETEVAEGRYAERVEAAAYFVVSEALANIAKHAQARSASISIWRLNGSLVVEVQDDGCGGAASTAGSGLQGLADRVGALDGRLTIESALSSGTTIRAEIPCASS